MNEMNKKRTKLFIIIGCLSIIIGFFSLSISHGKISSTLFFWTGFFLILWPMKHIPELIVISKWARIGLIINIIGILFYSQCYALLTSGNMNYTICMVARWIFNPIQIILEYIFPYKQIYVSDTEVGFAISHIRTTLTDFINILTFMGIAIVIGKIILQIEHLLLVVFKESINIR